MTAPAGGDHRHDPDHAPNHAHGPRDFDERAATWDDDPTKVERARTAADAIRAAVRLDRSTRLLEYGAGTGLVTQALRDDVGPVTLVDTSSGMRAVIERKIAAGALPDARVWDVDLGTDPPPDPDARFDLIVTVMVLHHVGDVDAVLAAFHRLLVDGGHLCVADLDEEDGTFHGDGFSGHLGFDRPHLAAALERAGFTDVAIEDCHQVEKGGTTYPMFLATGARRGPAAGG